MSRLSQNKSDANRISDLNVFTLIVWLGFLLIGCVGFALPYPRVRPLPPPQQPIKVEVLEIKLNDDPTPVSNQPLNPAVTEPHPQPQVPQAIPVAQPSPAIAFAIPVTGPVRIVEKRQAAYSQPTATIAPIATATVAPQPLTFGEGEGLQAAPEYPSRARREGQEGIVTVRFTVAEDGHVITAQAVNPSRWFLLNEAALRVVRERWHFSSGKMRVYDVSIRFELAR